jgi:hypothetical protein
MSNIEQHAAVDKRTRNYHRPISAVTGD